MKLKIFKLIILAILFSLACGCDNDVEEHSPVPVLREVIPEDKVPSNGYLILLFNIWGDVIDLDTLEITLGGVGGTVEGGGTIYIWKPERLLPIGPARLSIKGEGKSKHFPIEVREPSLLKITVVSPDNTPPALISTSPENGATDIDGNRGDFKMTFTYSEVVNHFRAKVDFEPAFGLKLFPDGTDHIAEIDTSIWSNDNKTIIVHLSESSKLCSGTNYTVTLSNVEDLAGNSGGDQKITFKTKGKSP
jgi:hypothetical protein